MTRKSDEYYGKTPTKNFKISDNVVMHSCYEARLVKYKGKIWECLTDSSIDKGTQEVVFLKGFSGAFFCEYLHFVDPTIYSFKPISI